MLNKAKHERRRLLDDISASQTELLADIERRRVHAELYGSEPEWPMPQQEPTQATSSQQPPPAYRLMSDAERAPWDAWLHAAIDAFRDEVQDAVSVGFAERDAHLDKLEAEILQLRADLTRSKSWWSRR